MREADRVLVSSRGSDLNQRGRIGPYGTKIGDVRVRLLFGGSLCGVRQRPWTRSQEICLQPWFYH